MKKYIIIPFVLSIIGHGLFFSVFKADAKSGISNQNIQLHLITKEQLDYLRSKDVIVSLLPKSLSNKNPIWKDVLDVIGVQLAIPADEDVELLEDYKGYSFQEIQIPSGGYPDLNPVRSNTSNGVNKEIIPIYSDLFYHVEKRIEQGSEYMLNLGNNIRMGYYIQGPVLSRRLMIGDIPDIDEIGIVARFRFWVTKDGRINQVIIEEGSSFPLVDSEIINFIKTWRFIPVFDPASPNYEWGIVRVRLLK